MPTRRSKAPQLKDLGCDIIWNMSGSGATRTEVLEWLKGGGVVVITVIGLFFYAFLSVPAIVFYSRLGVTPTEAGLSYINVLSGSTAEIIAILVVLTCAFLAAAFGGAFVGLFFRIAAVGAKYGPSYSFRRPYWELSDDEYEKCITFFATFFRVSPNFWTP
jgi:hypothetical protein